MKSAPQKFFLVFVSAALVLAGCTKKPTRPDPSATVLGPQPGAGSLNPEAVQTSPEGLQPREAGLAFDANGQLRGQLEAVYFDFDRSNIKAAERAKLQAAKDYLAKNPQYRFLLEGHCDWRGTAEYNLALGDRRSTEVKKFLQTLGVDPSKLDVLSKGNEEAAKNADESTMGKDRRVEFVILKPAGAEAASPTP
jgi:peptidoglycan-associated lipoprotein